MNVASIIITCFMASQFLSVIKDAKVSVLNLPSLSSRISIQHCSVKSAHIMLSCVTIEGQFLDLLSCPKMATLTIRTTKASTNAITDNYEHFIFVIVSLRSRSNY